MRWKIFLVLIILLGLNNRFVRAQSPNDVIINEILNGSVYKDAVELLVVKSGGVDMRGWTITDLTSPVTTPNTTEGYCTLPANPFLQNVPPFTRIVLVFTKSTGAASPILAQDTVFTDDSTLVLFSFGADSLLNPTPVGSGVNLGNNDNVVLIGGSNLSSDPVIDKVFYGTSPDSWSGSAVWVNNIADVASGYMAYFVNDSLGNLNNDNGASGKGWTSSAAEAGHTLGRINPGQLLGGRPIRLGAVTRTPTTPDSTQSVTVQTTIGFLNPPITAKVIFSYNAVTDSVTMTNPSDSTYQGVIPANPPGTKVYYFIKVTDNLNHVALSGTDSFTVSTPVVFTSIANIQANTPAYENQMVTITGIVVIGDSVLRATPARQSYVVDRSITSGVNGIQIYQGSFTAPKLNRGDSVIITGKVISYNGTTEITDPITLTVVSTGNSIPAPIKQSISQVMNVADEGKWVRIKGTVVDNWSAGGGYNVKVDDGTGNVLVRIWNSTGINGSAYAINSVFTFNTIIGIYNNATQLLLGYAADAGPDTAGQGNFKANIRVSPHPFNPMAGEKIKYALAYGENARIVLRVFDMTGRLITTLIDEVKYIGRDETEDPFRTWDGRTMESKQLVPVGTYIMHLEVTNRKTGKSSTKTAPIVIGTKLK